MIYKGYAGRIEYDDGAGLFHGEVIDTTDVITFQGTTAIELRAAFHDSVDDYLAFCEERGEKAEKPYSGQFTTRISPELHRLVKIAARTEKKSLNAWVSERLAFAVEDVLPELIAVRSKPGRTRKAVRDTKATPPT